MQGCGNVGIQEFRDTRMRECRETGRQGCGNVGNQGCRDEVIQGSRECGDTGMQEYRDTGKQGCREYGDTGNVGMWGCGNVRIQRCRDVGMLGSRERYSSSEEKRESEGRAHGVESGNGWEGEKRGGKNGRSSIYSLSFLSFSFLREEFTARAGEKPFPIKQTWIPTWDGSSELLGSPEFGPSWDFQLPAVISGSAIPKSPSRHSPCSAFAIPG